MVIATEVPIAFAHAKQTQILIRNELKRSADVVVLEGIKGLGSYCRLGHHYIEVTPITAAIVFDGPLLTNYHCDVLKVCHLQPLRLSLSPKTKCPKEILGASMICFEEGWKIQEFCEKSRFWKMSLAEIEPHITSVAIPTAQ